VAQVKRVDAMADGIFPISDREANILHDLGWNSGFGWRDEWDWWRDKDPDADETRIDLVRHVIAIREAVAAGEQLAKKILSTE
jgi:hypothetical protein